MNIHLPFRGNRARLGARAILASLFLWLAPLATFGQGVGGNPTNTGPLPERDGSGNSVTSNPEDVTSLPFVQDSSGVTLVGSWRQIRASLISVQGDGRFDVVRLSPTQLAVTLVGDFRIELDRARLADSGVAFFFRGGRLFHDGTARLDIVGSRPAIVDPDRVPLPIARLASIPRLQGDLVTLEVLGTSGQRAHVGTEFGPERIVLTQRAP